MLLININLDYLIIHKPIKTKMLLNLWRKVRLPQGAIFWSGILPGNTTYFKNYLGGRARLQNKCRVSSILILAECNTDIWVFFYFVIGNNTHSLSSHKVRNRLRPTFLMLTYCPARSQVYSPNARDTSDLPLTQTALSFPLLFKLLPEKKKISNFSVALSSVAYHYHWHLFSKVFFSSLHSQRKLRSCYTMQFSQQLVAIILLREALYEAATDCNNWQHHCTVYHPSSNLSRNFTTVLTSVHAHTSCFSFRGALRDKLLRKLHSVSNPHHQTSATCNAKFSTIARQVAEKIA